MAELPGIQYDKTKTYHKEVILKKEGKVWIEYYAVLVDKVLFFNRKDSKTGQIIPNNVTMIDISAKTQCGFDDNKKKCYRFPFWVETGKVKYQFKCETKLHRHKWMFAIRQCAGGKPPIPVPRMIPTVAPRSKQNRKLSHSGSGESKLSRSRNLTYNSATSSSISAPNNNNNNLLTVKNKTTGENLEIKRSKSVELFIKDKCVKDQKLQKPSSSVKDVILKRSRSLNEKTRKTSDKTKTTSWKLRFTIRSKSKTTTREDVLANKNVKDSMSDVYSSSKDKAEGEDETKKVKTIAVRPGSADELDNKMTLNDRFKSMSCDDVLQAEEQTLVEKLTESITGDDFSDNMVQKEKEQIFRKSKSLDKLVLDEKNEKHVFHTGLEEDDETVVDLADEKEFQKNTNEIRKQPCENDELDYPQRRKDSFSSKRDITQLFQASSSACSSRRGSMTIMGGAFTDKNKSTSSGQIYSKRKSIARKRNSIVSLISMKVERANSWTSIVGRKRPVEPLQRRENSAPSLKMNRTRQSNC